MFGSLLFRIVNGRWETEGYRKIVIPYTIPGGVIIPKGTWIDEDVTSEATLETQGVLASGHGIGFMTQDMNQNGLLDDTGFKNFSIGKLDNPVANGTVVSLRKPTLGAELEYEGGGVVGGGNLVCTSGTGALALNTARLTQLSVLAGSLRQAQTGDNIMFELLDTGLAKAVSTSDMRCRVRYLGGAAKK